MLAFSTGASFSPPETSMVIRETCSDLAEASGLDASVCGPCAREGCATAQPPTTTRHNAAFPKRAIPGCILSSTFILRRSSRLACFDAGFLSHGSRAPQSNKETANLLAFDAFSLLLYLRNHLNGDGGRIRGFIWSIKRW